jgi:F-type H+-transporting ATPase subunit b
MNTPRILLTLAALTLASPALGAPHGKAKAGHGEHTEQADAHGGGHGDAHGDHGGHGAEGVHAIEGGHDDHGGGHHYYTADDDGDGTANWMDADSDMYVVSDLLFHFVHLLLFIGIVGFLAMSPLKDALRSRAARIRKELTDSARERDEAYQRHQELSARLDKISAEIAAMEAEATTEAANEEQQLVERAQREAARIAETAQRNVRDEATRARMALKRDAVELAVQLAEGILARSVTPADQQALARDFLQSLDSDQQPSA